MQNKINTPIDALHNKEKKKKKKKNHIDPSTIQDMDQFRSVVKLLLNALEVQSADNEQLRRENQELRDEINRLKGEQGKPKFPPGSTSKPNRDISSEKQRRKKNRKKGSKKPRIQIDRTEHCRVDKSELPADAYFKGYDEVIQQNLYLMRDNVRYVVERYYSPIEGKVYRARLPEDYRGEFGADLKSVLQLLHHTCDVTHGRLEALLESVGIQISSGTISNILVSGGQWACEEQKAILKAGIEHSPYTQVDSTKSKEKGQGKATQIIGSEFFTVFYTMDSKSRLDVLRAFLGKPSEDLSLCLNPTSRQLLDHFGVAQADRQFLEEHFGDGRVHTIPVFEAYMQEHAPNIRSKKNMFRRILESLALGHYHEQTDFPVIESLLSDDAGEYTKIARERHALCWIHDARHYNKLSPKIEIHRSTKEDFQKQYWDFYYQLLDFKELPAAERSVQKLKLEQEFETLFSTSTDYFQLNGCIQRTYANQEKLLAVLDNAALPLHNNAAELGARRVVRKRDISLHTWSEKGTRAKDAFMSIVETAAKLGVSAIDYIADRISEKHQMPSLASMIHQAYQ